MEAALAATPDGASRAGAPPSRLTGAGRPCAWVVLVMLGSGYAPGALVAAQSLREHSTRHALVCMVTADVPPETRAQLGLLYDEVVEVPYVQQRVQPLVARKQAEHYSGWIDRGFTKWACLALTGYARVALVDADMVFVANCDELFELAPPAACYSSPWARPRGRLEDHYAGAAPRAPLAHGARVDPARVLAALHGGGFVGWGALVLLEPSAAHYEDFLGGLRAAPVFGAAHRTASAADEAAIAEFYALRGVHWTHIHPRYLAIPWKGHWAGRGARAYHYHGRKPWDMPVSEWPDLATWWGAAGRAAAAHPSLRPLLGAPGGALTLGGALGGRAGSGREVPLEVLLAVDAAALRLTRDIRALLVSRLVRRCGFSKEDGWLLAEKGIRAWLPSAGAAPQLHYAAAAARRDALAETLRGARTPAAEIKALTGAARALVAGRLRAPVRLDAPASLDAPAPALTPVLSHGSHFTVSLTPRLAALVERGGHDRAVAVAQRYAAALEAQRPRYALEHPALLCDELGVLNEAFASPLDACLYGVPGAVYYSAHPDTDAVFGAAGEFFTEWAAAEARVGAAGLLALRPGNWYCGGRSASGATGSRAASLLERALRRAERTLVFITDDARVCRILRGSPFCVGGRRLEASELTPPASGPPAECPGAAWVYVLSSQAAPARARLAAARIIETPCAPHKHEAEERRDE